MHAALVLQQGLLCVSGSEQKTELPNLCFSGHLNSLVLHSPAAQHHQQTEALQTFLGSRRQSITRQNISGAHLAGWHSKLQHDQGNCPRSYLGGICETWLSSTGGSSTWESSALPREAPGPTKFPMRAVLLLGQRGCAVCYLSNSDKCVLQL